MSQLFMRQAPVVALSVLVGLSSAFAATITVDSTFDDFDLGPNGNCTLREAVLAANTNSVVDACVAGEAGPGVTDRIAVPAGLFILSVGGPGEDGAEEGDLDLTDTVEIEGAGARLTVVDGNGLDRVFDVDPGQGGMPAAILRLTIRGGSTGAEGGGVRNGGTLTLDRCTIAGSSAVGPGGGIRNDVEIFVLDSAIVGNLSGDHGGGVDNHAQAFFQNVTVSGNSVSGGGPGGGLYNLAGQSLSIMASTVADNSAAVGSAVHNAGSLSASHLLVVGSCDGSIDTSNGGSVESPGNTCGLDHVSDQANVADAGLGPLADNGGGTDTHFLSPGSPAIDVGVNGLCPPEDQRGMPRPFDGDYDSVADCDAGALERSVGPFIFADGFESGDAAAWSVVVPK